MLGDGFVFKARAVCFLPHRTLLGWKLDKMDDISVYAEVEAAA